MKTERLIPLAAMEQILKKTGAERVSECAKKELKIILEEYAKKISANAVLFAKHTGRKTVKSEDIKLSLKKL